MDPILASLPASLLRLVEDQLSNNEVSSDEELLDHFISDGLTEEQARQALTYRDQYLANLYLDGFTPTLKRERSASPQPLQPAIRAGLNRRSVLHGAAFLFT